MMFVVVTEYAEGVAEFDPYDEEQDAYDASVQVELHEPEAFVSIRRMTVAELLQRLDEQREWL